MRTSRYARNGFALTVMLLVAGFVVPARAAIPPMSDEELVQRSDLILGVDGAAYLPYKDTVVEWVQTELKQRNLYAGEATGVLDSTTKDAIAEFQRNHGLHVSGIPSPLTRQALHATEEDAVKAAEPAA